MVNFDNLNYSSLYGTTRIVKAFQAGGNQKTDSFTISGTIGAGATTQYRSGFELGVPYDPAIPGEPDSNGVTYPVYIPKPTASIWVNSSTAPNDSSRWFQVGSNPRPITVGSNLGNLNMNVYYGRNTSTSSAPSLFYINFDVYNPYGGTATITSTAISLVAYGFSNS